jgi:hypothetical protein
LILEEAAMATVFIRTKLPVASTGVERNFFHRIARRFYEARLTKAMAVVNEHRKFLDVSCR